MSPKIYTQEFKRAVVKFYAQNHTIAETLAEFKISESSLFEWRKQYKNSHDLIINGAPKYKNFRQKQDHLHKTELMMEVLKRTNCSPNSSINDKYSAIRKLEGQYSVHVLCEALGLSRGTYYNRKRRENVLTSYDENDEIIKPFIKRIFDESKGRFGRKPIHHKLKEMGYCVSEK